MIRELKYLFFLIVIFFALFFTIRYYFSDENHKNLYRSISQIDTKLQKLNPDLFLLKNDTENIIEYVENNVGQNKKIYHFLELLIND